MNIYQLLNKAPTRIIIRAGEITRPTPAIVPEQHKPDEVKVKQEPVEPIVITKSEVDIEDIPKDAVDVELPNCLTIRMNAFKYMPTLRSVKAPVVKTVERNAFTNCQHLCNIELPQCKTIYECAFENCKALTSIDFPACDVIYYRAFACCEGLQSIKLKSCSNLKPHAFYGCSKLAYVSLPTIEILDIYAFDHCKQFQQLSAPMCMNVYNSDLWKDPHALVLHPSCHCIHMTLVDMDDNIFTVWSICGQALTKTHLNEQANKRFKTITVDVRLAISRVIIPHTTEVLIVNGRLYTLVANNAESIVLHNVSVSDVVSDNVKSITTSQPDDDVDLSALSKNCPKLVEIRLLHNNKLYLRRSNVNKVKHIYAPELTSLTLRFQDKTQPVLEKIPAFECPSLRKFKIVARDVMCEDFDSDKYKPVKSSKPRRVSVRRFKMTNTISGALMCQMIRKGCMYDTSMHRNQLKVGCFKVYGQPKLITNISAYMTDYIFSHSEFVQLCLKENDADDVRQFNPHDHLIKWGQVENITPANEYQMACEAANNLDRPDIKQLLADALRLRLYRFLDIIRSMLPPKTVFKNLQGI